jgi:excinuclease UvrABC nuclease subunit
VNTDCSGGARFDTPTYIYFLYNDAGEVIYIGVSHKLSFRRYGHERYSPWWPEVASWRLVGPFPHRDAYLVERDFIRAHEPRYNIRHTSRYIERARRSPAPSAVSA